MMPSVFSTSLIKRTTRQAYRLLDRMTERAYRHHRANLFNLYGI
ncbi:hypothetical protein [Vreelandella titanicae]|nr:hypothetical protein [Halomonas titanicae]